ncbi:MAG: DMT family transporter [Rhodospirillales bacterium]
MNTQPRQDNATLGITLVVSAMFIFATQDAITKTLAETYSAPQILWVRFVFYAAFALAFSMRKRPLKFCLKSNAPWLQIARSLLIVAEIAMFIISIRYLSLAEMHALLATFPLMVTAIAALFLGEPVGIRRWSAVFAGFVGVLIIIRPGIIDLKPGVLLALVTALMFAGYNVMTRLVAKYDDGETSTVYMAVVGAVAMTVIGPFYWIPVPLMDWFWLICLSFTAAAGHFLLIKALEAAPASTLQPFNYTLLVFATVIGYIFFDNLPDVWTVVGASVVVGSGLYTIYRERRRKQAG